MEHLIDKQTTIEQLKAWAIRDNRTVKMSSWVDTVFEPTPRPFVPFRTAEQKRLRNGSIGYYELRAVASMWDLSGHTGPLDFVNAVECETEGTKKNAVVLSATAYLGTIDLEEEGLPWDCYSIQGVQESAA